MRLLILVLLSVLLPALAPVHRPVVRARTRRARRGLRPSTSLEVARMVESLAVVLGTGLSGREAWHVLTEVRSAGTNTDTDLDAFVRAVADGADPARVAPGGLATNGAFRTLSAALTVCATSGAPVSTVLHSLASALRDLHDADQARDSAYAGPLATARLLLALPPAGIALGMLLGADPLATLTGSTAGLLLLVAGLALTALGWWWMRRLTRQAAGHRTDEVDPSVTLDLVAGTLRAGLAPASALGTVGAALGSDPLGRSLSEFAGALRSGVPVPTALRHLPSSLEALGRSVLLSQRSGADLAQILHAAARDERRGRAREAEAAAARMAVRLVVPTGVALLPAFLVLGIIPTIASLLGGPLGGSLGGGFTTDVLTTG